MTRAEAREILMRVTPAEYRWLTKLPPTELLIVLDVLHTFHAKPAPEVNDRRGRKVVTT